MSTDHSPRYGSAAPQTGPIVFVHGSLSSARIWAPYAAAMATQKTICIDLPGYGAEPAWPAEAPYRLNNAAATIKSDTDRETLFKQFQQWDAERNARAQVRPAAAAK